MSSSQIGKMFYGVMKGSRVSWNCWIELHCSVALLLWGSRSQVSYVCPWKFNIFFFTIIRGKIRDEYIPNMERKKPARIYLNLRNLCIYLWRGSHTSLQVVFQTVSHSQAPPCLYSCYSLTWCYLFLLWALCVLSLSWRLHSCILISVKSSLLPFNKYPATLLLLTSRRLLHKSLSNLFTVHSYTFECVQLPILRPSTMKPD